MEEYQFAALRAVQIDARLLDKTLLSLLQAQIDQILDTANCLQLYKQHFRECIPPLYFLSHFLTGQSPGQRLLHIRSNFSTIKGLFNYVLCFLLPPIAAIMIRLRASDRKMQLWYSSVETAYHLVDFIHFCFFLTRGGPIRLCERLLRIRTVYVQTPTLGSLNLAALNRELLGHSFVHLCFLLIPLFNVLKQRLLTVSRRSFQIPRHDNSNETLSGTRKLKLRDIVRCKECGQTAIGAVRARRKNTHKDGEGWKEYCLFCLFQSDAFGNGDQFQWEMLNVGK